MALNVEEPTDTVFKTFRRAAGGAREERMLVLGLKASGRSLDLLFARTSSASGPGSPSSKTSGLTGDELAGKPLHPAVAKLQPHEPIHHEPLAGRVPYSPLDGPTARRTASPPAHERETASGASRTPPSLEDCPPTVAGRRAAHLQPRHPLLERRKPRQDLSQ